jgi:hypothetical protein
MEQIHAKIKMSVELGLDSAKHQDVSEQKLDLIKLSYMREVEYLIREHMATIESSHELISMDELLGILAKIETNLGDLVQDFFSKRLKFGASTLDTVTRLEEPGFQIPGLLSTSPADGTLQMLSSDATMSGPRGTYFKDSKSKTCDEPEQRKLRLELVRKATPLLNEWLDLNKADPYPSREEKLALCKRTGLTYTQITNWFINKRINRKLNKTSSKRGSNLKGTRQGSRSDHTSLGHL